jgi:hypothetical protein
MPKVPQDKAEEDGELDPTEMLFEEGFWAIEVKPGATFKQIPKLNIVHITHASLGVDAKGRNVLLSDNLPVCVLTRDKDEHTALDMRFVPNQEMKFSISGSSSITLTGYYEVEDLYHDDDDEDEQSFLLDQARQARFGDEDSMDDEEDEEEEEGKKGVLVPINKMSLDEKSDEDENEDEKIDDAMIGGNKKRPAPNADKAHIPPNKKAKQEGGAAKNPNAPKPNKPGEQKSQQEKKGGEKKGGQQKQQQGNKGSAPGKPNPNAQKGYNDNAQKKKNKNKNQKQGNK